MNREEIVEKTIEVIRSAIIETGEETDYVNSLVINEETDIFKDLGMDSIQVMTVITDLEDIYDMEFADEDMDMDYLLIVSNLVDSVERGILKSA